MTAYPIPSHKEALGLPDKPVVRLALSFARIGRADLRASKLLYGKKLYPQSIFYLQQSVEKSVKTTGLLLRLVGPNKEDLMHEVGHTTIFGILIRRGERIAQLRRNLGILAASERQEEGKELLLKLGIPWTIPDPKAMEARLVSEQAAKDQIETLRNLQPRDLWRITLKLDPKTPLTAAILKLLDDAEAQWRYLDRFQRLFERKLSSLVSDPQTFRYIINVHGKAFPEIAPLAFITIWHEKETRYPPVDGSDYWSPDQYSGDSGLITLYPRLQKHAKRLSEGAYAGARAALGI